MLMLPVRTTRTDSFASYMQPRILRGLGRSERALEPLALEIARKKLFENTGRTRENLPGQETVQRRASKSVAGQDHNLASTAHSFTGHATDTRCMGLPPRHVRHIPGSNVHR